MSATRSGKDILLFLIVGVVLLGFLAMAAIRTADLYYKAGWIVAHFPPKGTICTELFCLRTDTSKPERSFMKLHFAYCPEHLSGGFQGRGGRSVGVLIYMAVFMTLLSFVTVPILGLLFRVVARPFAAKADPGKLESAGMWTGAVVAVVAISLYCWW